MTHHQIMILTIAIAIAITLGIVNLILFFLVRRVLREHESRLNYDDRAIFNITTELNRLQALK